MRGVTIAAVLAGTLALGGCTKERALALSSGADKFAAQAGAAIDAVVALHVRGALGRVESDELLIGRTRDSLLKASPADARMFDAVVKESFKWVNEREAFASKSFADADKLKRAYVEFASAYRKLPQASLFASREVACSAGLAARLVKYMADAAGALASAPVPLGYEQVMLDEQLRATTTSVLKTKQLIELDAAVRARVDLLREQARVNEQAVAKLADAAHAGWAVLRMIETYDQVSASDLMNAARDVLVFSGSSFGLSTQDQIKRLDLVVDKIKERPELAQAMSLPIDQKPAQCTE